MRRIWTALISALLATLLCAVAVCGALPTDAEREQDLLALGIAGRENNSVLDGAQLYEALFGDIPTAATADYLNAQGLTLRYNDAISAGCISTDYRAEEGVLALTVRPYRYTAENGAEVVWLPTGATVDGQQVVLTEADGVYSARLEGLFRTENFDMTVDFAWSVVIPHETVDEVRNGAYRAGSTALSAQRDYELAYAEYERLCADYIAWQTYLEKKLAYDAYAEALRAYTEQVKAYEAYVTAKAIYDKENAAYTEWQTYYADLAVYTAQYERYSAYQSYLSAMETAEHKLTLIRSIYISDSHGWKMYSSIMGGTVTKVINGKDELVDALHCSEEDVDLAGASTEALRALLKEYDNIRKKTYASGYEKSAAEYAYFVKNYSALQLHFTNLYKTLKGFLSNTFVERALEMEGQRDHYLQFVGQLYVISTCLDSEGERRADWTIGGKKLEEVVEEQQRVPDGDWDPRISPFPALVAPAECPNPITPPAVAMPSHKPVPPTPVLKPSDTPPAPVEDPDKGVIPPRCDEAPLAEPVAPVFDGMTLALMEEIETGKLALYTGEAVAKTLSFAAHVTRPVSILNEKLVTFYDIEGNLLYQVLVNYGAALSYAPPEHEPSPAYEYRLLGWIGAEGNEVDLRFITTDLDLYPNYEITKKSYTVTWRVIGADGQMSEFSSVWTYGSLPVPGAQVPCVSYEENGYLYEFSGWDREVLPVTEHVTYTGTVTKTPKNYPVTWVMGERTVIELWAYGTVPSFEGDTSISSPSYSYTFLGWSPAVSAVEGAATYVARYEKQPYATSGTAALEIAEDAQRMTVLADTHASVSITDALERASETQKEFAIRWESGCELVLDAASVGALGASDCSRIVLQSFTLNGDTVFELHFYNSLLKEASLGGATPVLHLPFATAADGKTTAFFLSSDGEETRIEQDLLPVTAATVIRCTYVYPLTVAPDPNCNTLSLGYDAVPGEVISLRLPCLFGYEVTGADVTDADGNVIALNNLSFVMPASAVAVTLHVEKIEYRVIFRSEGKVLSDTLYSYGEAIKIPPAPQKSAEGETVYTFISWGSEVPTHATGDVRELVFDAVFSAQIKDIDYDTGHNNNLLAEVILPVAFGCLLLVGGAITAIVIVRRRRR